MAVAHIVRPGASVFVPRRMGLLITLISEIAARRSYPNLPEKSYPSYPLKVGFLEQGENLLMVREFSKGQPIKGRSWAIKIPCSSSIVTWENLKLLFDAEAVFLRRVELGVVRYHRGIEIKNRGSSVLFVDELSQMRQWAPDDTRGASFLPAMPCS